MMNFNNPQQPGMYPAIDEIGLRVHGSVPFILAAVLSVGGYFWGIEQDTLPVALCVGIGLVLGLLLDALLLGGIKVLLTIGLVAAAGYATFVLLKNDAALKHGRSAAPAAQAAPAGPRSSRGVLDDLRKVVQP